MSVFFPLVSFSVLSLVALYFHKRRKDIAAAKTRSDPVPWGVRMWEAQEKARKRSEAKHQRMLMQLEEVAQDYKVMEKEAEQRAQKIQDLSKGWDNVIEKTKELSVMMSQIETFCAFLLTAAVADVLNRPSPAGGGELNRSRDSAVPRTRNSASAPPRIRRSRLGRGSASTGRRGTGHDLQ